MSTRQKINEMLDNFSEDQLNSLLKLMTTQFVEKRPDPKIKEQVDKAFGILHYGARPEMIPGEKGVWERAYVTNKQN